jgi:hypothetical protein
MNLRYCTNTGTDKNKIGQRVDLAFDELFWVERMLFQAAVRTDKVARRKLSLKATRFKRNAT